MPNIQKILLMQIHYTHNRCIPLSIAYIAAVLEKEGYSVEVYDPLPYEEYDIERKIVDFKPDIVGISCMSATFNKALGIAKRIKHANKNIPIVFGGIHVTALPKESLSNIAIDYVIIGEGEYTFLDLIKAVNNNEPLSKVKGLAYKKDNDVFVNEPRPLIQNLDELPLPARHLFPRWYFMRWMVMRGQWLNGTNMMSSRGCVYDCSYCASKVMFGRQVRFISPLKVVDEIEHLAKDYKIKAIAFSDDTFSLNEARAIEICSEIIRRKLNKKIKFRVQLRANTASDSLLKNLKEAGCIQVDIGVESGSQRILNLLNKAITVRQVRNAFSLFKKYNLNTCATFMIGNPTESAKEINADYTQFFITTPYPGTKLYNDLSLNFNDLNFNLLHHGGVELKSYVNSKIPAEQLTRLQQELNNEFLKKSGLKMMLKPLLIYDTILLALQQPSLVKDAIVKAYKTKKIVELYRTFYEGHNFRRF